MATIPETDHDKHSCPWNEFKPCIGSRCMAWAWHSQYPETATTNNLIDTVDGLRPGEHEPMPPDGRADWKKSGPAYLTGYQNSNKLGLPRMAAQLWVRRDPVTHGYCSRAGSGDCGGPF